MQKELYEMTLEELWQLFPIILTEHNPNWDDWYEEERQHLWSILTPIDVVRISHIGSTAIRGIWAKPIVDVLVEVKSIEDFRLLDNALRSNSYICMSANETRLDFNKGYTKYGFAERVFHIHIRLTGDHDELYFRDYMNENPQVAKEYEALKLSLWKQFEHNRDAYTNAKTQFIKKYTEKAKKMFANKYE